MPEVQHGRLSKKREQGYAPMKLIMLKMISVMDLTQYVSDDIPSSFSVVMQACLP